MARRPAPSDAPTPAVDGPDVRDMAAQLRLSTTRLARQLRRESDTGLTPSQLSVLATIDRHGSLTLGALAEHERVAPPSITRVVTKLQDDGLVRRTTDPGDRRVRRLALTPRATALIARSRERRNEWLGSRLAQLDPADRARLAAALDVLDRLASGELAAAPRSGGLASGEPAAAPRSGGLASGELAAAPRSRARAKRP